jgi:hypothetical protein
MHAVEPEALPRSFHADRKLAKSINQSRVWVLDQHRCNKNAQTFVTGAESAAATSNAPFIGRKISVPSVSGFGKGLLQCGQLARESGRL